MLLAADHDLTVLATAPAKLASLWRVRAHRVRPLARLHGTIDSLSVDSRLIAAATRAGNVVVIRPDGRVLLRLRFPRGSLAGIALDRQQLIILRSGHVLVYDTNSGQLENDVRLEPTGGGYRLLDAATGVAIYLEGEETHPCPACGQQRDADPRPPGPSARARGYDWAVEARVRASLAKLLPRSGRLAGAFERRTRPE